MNDTIAETLGIVPYTEPIDVPAVSKDTEDFDYARENLHQVIETGKIAMNKALHIASEAESPRAFEVLATLLKTVADTNGQLVDLHKKNKESGAPEKQKEQPQTVNNVAILTGTLQDVDAFAQKLLGKQTENVIIENT